MCKPDGARGACASKAEAWDALGSAYWNAGYRGGPSGRDIELYLAGAGPGVGLVVVGASTRFLIGAALERGLRVTVLDFSMRMLADLRAEVGGGCGLVRHDITRPVPAGLAGGFDLLVADRLINRFTEAEALSALREMLRLLGDSGEIRTGIRLGLYRRDLPLIEEGRRRGILGGFFDEATMTIDYGRAGTLLDELIPPHGDIPRARLLAFYRKRGPEKRFTPADIERYVSSVGADGRGLVIAGTGAFHDAEDDTLYRMRPRKLD